jgi:hypothetical protein
MFLQGPIIMKQTLGIYGDPFSLYGKQFSSSKNIPFLKGFALSSIRIYSKSFEKLIKLYSVDYKI